MTKLPVHLQGTTRHYKGNGRKLGYPTANIDAKTSLIDGVYFGFATMDKYKNQPAMIFIGTPVTVGDTERRVEAYLLDIPDADYYGQELSLDIQLFHRPNKKFDSLDELIVAIKQDEAAMRAWIKR
jgi:riboflavin kinase / FMN adenylyltransferase